MNLGLVTKVFLDINFDLKEDADASVVNCGWCFHWAYVAYKLCGGTLCTIFVNDEPYHAVLKLDGKYHDAVNSKVGEEDFRELRWALDYHPNWRWRIPGELKIIEESEEEFINRWGFIPDLIMIECVKNAPQD